MTIFRITTPHQQIWVEQKHAFEDVPPYNSDEAPNKAIWGVKIVDGRGETDDALKAVDFCDMGCKVEPDPHEEANKLIREREMNKELQEIEAEESRNILAENTRLELLEMQDRKRAKKTAGIPEDDPAVAAPAPAKRRVTRPAEA